MFKFRNQLLGWPCYWTPNRSILKEGSFCQTAKILQDSKTAWAFVLGILKTRRISGKWQNIELIWKKSFQNQTIALKWKIQELLQRGKSQPSRLRENKLTTEPFWKREPIYHRIWKRQESKGRVFLFVCRFVFVIVFFFYLYILSFHRLRAWAAWPSDCFRSFQSDTFLLFWFLVSHLIEFPLITFLGSF